MGAYEKVPRVIWMLWFDGWGKATELHRRCLESWQLFNLGWEVRTISRADIPGLLGDFMPRYEALRAAMNPLEQYGGFWIPPAAESDLLRLLLLVLYGGIWVDSTMLCRRALDTWLPQAAATGFFAFAPESPAEDIPVMSAFIAAERAHSIVAGWLSRVIKHWSLPRASRRDLGFFWVHKIFGEMTGEHGDAEVKKAWEEVPRVSGEYGLPGPHFWVKYTERLLPPPTPDFREVLEKEWETPMWKLTNHEVKLADVGPETCYWQIMEQTEKKAREHAAEASGGGLGPALSIMASAPPAAVAKALLATGEDVGCH